MKKGKLTNRTKLTPAQYARAEGESGAGAASKYAPTGNGFQQSLELTRRLFKASRKAAKFVLYTELAMTRLYLKEDQREALLTSVKAEARVFIEGLDEPTKKIRYWNEVTGLKFLETKIYKR